MRILFSMREFWYVKQYESVVRALASRGHQICIAADRGKRGGRYAPWTEAVAALAADVPGVSFEWIPRSLDDRWLELATNVRQGLDYLRFLDPAYRHSPKLGARARRRAPLWVLRLAELPGVRSRVGVWALTACLRAIEGAIPVDPEIGRYITSQRPDVVLLTPLIALGSDQLDVLRSARALGIRTALCVASWDHLSSKALIRALPDLVIVWNETQKNEVTELHGVPADRVTVTGAQCFDEWFERRPALDGGSFCRKVGLCDDRPYVLYVCSALLEGSPSEAPFVEAWIRHLRASADPVLREAGVLIRPHPKRAREWQGVDLSSHANVRVWPPVSSDPLELARAPLDAESKADYFDSIYHSAAVVGLNTSALIEAGIIGRSVHTVLIPEFYDNQEGTLHFGYLLNVGGGLLSVARSLNEHVAALAESLARDDYLDKNRAFIEAFVRPQGIERPSTPVFADVVEGLAAIPGFCQARTAWWEHGLRWAIRPLAGVAQRRAGGQLVRKRHRYAQELEREALIRRRAEERAERLRQERLREQETKMRIAAEKQDAKARVQAERRVRELETKARLAAEKEARASAKEKARRAQRAEKDRRREQSHKVETEP